MNWNCLKRFRVHNVILELYLWKLSEYERSNFAQTHFSRATMCLSLIQENGSYNEISPFIGYEFEAEWGVTT